ncbi:MAG TPA: discoidin domain-containing protein [Armatimonadota bacterium]|nr:discoidin domain-containing protein [Armatimonadota bacterium]
MNIIHHTTCANASAMGSRIARVQCLRSFILFAVLCAAGAANQPARAADFAPQFVHAADGSWSISTPEYTAAVNKDGYLSSFQAHGVEAIGDPVSYQPNAKLVMDQSHSTGDTLLVHLKGAGQAEIDYTFRPDGFTITPTWRGTGYAQFQFHASKRLLGIELLNDKSVTTGGEATHFVDHGEVRGVPAVPSSRNQMVRFHYPQFNLHAYVQAWGAPFNYESAGAIRDYSWGRSLMDANRPFPIIFTMEPSTARDTLPAPVFVPRSEKTASLYYVNELCTWQIDMGDRASYQYLIDAGIRTLNLHWRLTDIHDQPAGEGDAPIVLDPAAAHTRVPVTLRLPGSGWYYVLFTLSDPRGRFLPSSFLTRFTAIHRVPGLINRDDSLAGKSISDYAVMGMIGIGGIRESHNIGDFFTNHAPKGDGWVPVAGADPPVWMNTRSLDDLFNTALAQSQKYHITYFFQANSRPPYATPPVYEAMAYALVSRYKDRCHVWEVENEPNFSYTPANYVKQSLTPFAHGAKRADPTCIVMGPACVSLKQTLEFVDVIDKVGADKLIDNFSTHTYPGPGESWEQFGNLATIAELRQWMAKNGDGDKALWQTEQGYAWDNAPKGQCARYTVRQFLQGWRLGIQPDHQYYFYPAWHGFEDWYLSGSGEAGSENSWLPSAAALRFLAESSAGMKYVGDVPSPYKGIYLARFSGPVSDMIAAWTFDFPITLKARAPEMLSMVSYMGNPEPFKPDHGVTTLRLSGEPIYLFLKKGASFTIVTSPFGRNVAGAAAGASAAASSEDPKHPASFANDGNWNLWEDVIGIPGRTAWQSAEKDPSPTRPDWLEITFPVPRVINRIIALCYLPAVSASPRDFLFQVDDHGKWRTVGSGKDEFDWVFEREFAPVRTQKIRMKITGINDGWQGDRHWMSVLMGPKATNYTDSKVQVTELEAYGPPTPQSR